NETLNHVVAVGTNRIAINGWMGKIAEVTEEAGGRLKEAEALWREAAQSSERDFGPAAPLTLQQQFGLARTLVRLGQRPEAIPLLERLIAQNEARFGRDNFSTLVPQFWLGRAYEEEGDIERAAHFYSALYPG